VHHGISNPLFEKRTVIISYSYERRLGNVIQLPKTLKMKKLFAIVLLVIALGATVTSCTASRGGCKATAGMAGYR